MKMGVVADDVTGSNDIGIMFAKGGYAAHVYTYEGAGTLERAPRLDEADVCVLDTDSRFYATRSAYEKVFAATRDLQRAGCPRFFNKTCSVFRGNIGAEFDAMLDALGEEFAIVVLGFPKNGRITRDGIHYVHGRRLEESEFRNDPMHPMTRSNLVEILQSQTERRVGLVTHEVVSQGARALRERIEVMRSQCNYLILDVADQEALRTIAEATVAYKVFCGSSALAEELPAAWEPLSPRAHSADLPELTGVGVLCAAASLMPQTAAQIAHLRERGTPTWELDTLGLFDSGEREQQVARLTGELARHLQEGEDVLLHASNDPESVEQTRAEGTRRGFSKTELSRLVSGTLAEVVAGVVERTGVNRLAILGGDTSAAVCARLGVTGMRVWKEIQPGLPSCISLNEPPMLLVLKSGSFGSPDFVEQAIAHLKSEA